MLGASPDVFWYASLRKQTQSASISRRLQYLRWEPTGSTGNNNDQEKTRQRNGGGLHTTRDVQRHSSAAFGNIAPVHTSSWPGERDTTNAAVTAVEKRVGEDRPPGIAKQNSSTESELAVSSGEARHPDIARHSARTESELTGSSGGAGPPWSRADGMTSGAATAVAKSADEAWPPGIAMHSATTETAPAEAKGGAGPPWCRAHGTTSAETDHAESSAEESSDEDELRTAQLFAGMPEARAALIRISLMLDSADKRAQLDEFLRNSPVACGWGKPELSGHVRRSSAIFEATRVSLFLGTGGAGIGGRVPLFRTDRRLHKKQETREREKKEQCTQP